MEFNELLTKIEKASQIINRQFSGLKLTSTLTSIINQLAFIKNDLEKSQSGLLLAKDDDVKRIVLGIQAVREIEQQNEDLADLLCDIDYEYKNLHGISNIV